MSKRNENPPERRPFGLQSIYRVFDSVRHFRGEHTDLVFFHPLK